MLKKFREVLAESEHRLLEDAVAHDAEAKKQYDRAMEAKPNSHEYHDAMSKVHFHFANSTVRKEHHMAKAKEHRAKANALRGSADA